MNAIEAKTWVAPKMDLIGQIGDVANAANLSTQQSVNTCNGSPTSCRS
jgi:hypothetical protein